MFYKSNLKILQLASAILISSSAYAAEDIILIDSCEALQTMNNNLDGSYRLMGEQIDCSGVNILPIGKVGKEFTGLFDGNNVPITNLIIEREESYVGLFGAISGKATIQNVNLVDAKVRGISQVGLLVGGRTGTITGGTSVLQNNTLSGSLIGGGSTGGLIGEILSNNNHGSAILNNNTIKNFFLNVQGIETSGIGGLVGRGMDVEINNSTVEGSIIAEKEGMELGGLVGYYRLNQPGVISNSSTQININALNFNFVGGLIGNFRNYSGNGIMGVQRNITKGNIVGRDFVGGVWGNNISFDVTVYIIDSFSEANVSGRDFVGGLAGFLMQVNVDNSFATGTIKGTTKVGGFAGETEYANINNAYARGNVTGTYAGGLIGRAYGGSIVNTYATGKVEGHALGGLIATAGAFPSVVGSFWDVKTTGQNISAGGIPASTTELKDQEFLEFYDWDFNTIWYIPSGEYPMFQNK